MKCIGDKVSLMGEAYTVRRIGYELYHLDTPNGLEISIPMRWLDGHEIPVSAPVSESRPVKVWHCRFNDPDWCHEAGCPHDVARPSDPRSILLMGTGPYPEGRLVP